MPGIVQFSLDSRDYQFRQPDLGNSNKLAFQRVNSRSRGGDIILFRDGDWPKTETQSLTFTFTCSPDADRFKYFLRLTLGRFLTYQDHEGQLWFGTITTPDAQMVQTGKNSWAITIEFEGDLA